jgi:tRNA A37 threonylcarbamoyltransferase TsaD
MVGEAFDKTARMLGLPLGRGGGPAVEFIAMDGDPNSILLPIPLLNRKDCDFSFAGLKTAVNVAADKLRVERGLDSIQSLSGVDKANIAASFQNTAIKHIEQRLRRAMTIFEKECSGPIRTLAVVGGVAANKELRSRLEKVCLERDETWNMIVPPPRLCTDQGSMSAWAAIERLFCHSSDDPEYQKVFARYPFQQSVQDSV